MKKTFLALAGVLAFLLSTQQVLPQSFPGTSPLTVDAGGTGVATFSTNCVPFGAGTSPLGCAASGNNRVWMTGATGIPASSATLPTAVQDNITRLGTIAAWGTGVQTSLGVNIGSVGSSVLNGGVLGTPSSGTATNLTGLPISTGVSGLGTSVATFLATPSSANLRAALTDETGTGIAYFVGGALGTPSSGTATNLTGLPISTGVSGLGTNVATALAVNVGTAGSPVVNGGVLGTPSSGTATNLTGLPISTGVGGLGTSVATALAVNVGTAGSPVINGGVLGTPSSGTATNITGLPISTGVSGLGTGVATFLATPSSANLRTALTDETGSGGSAVFATAPTISAAILTGLVDFQGAVKFSTQSAPAQITANQNDYNPSSVICATTSTLFVNSDAARDITGLAGGTAGCQLRLVNNGSFTILLKEESASSTAANRFSTGADVTLASKAGVTLIYDSIASRWRNTSPASGGGGGAGTVTSVTCGTGLSGGAITTSGTCAVLGYSLKSIVTINSSQTYTVPASVRALYVIAKGAGGGGGYVIQAGAGTLGTGGGGGAGACSAAWLSSLSASYVVTIGAGGTGGVASGPTAAGAGGDTTFAAVVVAKGGLGGGSETASATVPRVGGAGGAGGSTGSGVGDSLYRGSTGQAGMSLSLTTAVSGVSGSNPCNGGSIQQRTTAGAGADAEANTGSGGTGAFGNSTVSRDGGAGGSGQVIVYEYY